MIGREAQAHSFRCLKFRKMSSHAQKTIKMAAVRPDVNWMSWFQRDKLLTKIKTVVIRSQTAAERSASLTRVDTSVV